MKKTGRIGLGRIVMLFFVIAAAAVMAVVALKAQVWVPATLR